MKNDMNIKCRKNNMMNIDFCYKFCRDKFFCETLREWKKSKFVKIIKEIVESEELYE